MFCISSPWWKKHSSFVGEWKVSITFKSSYCVQHSSRRMTTYFDNSCPDDQLHYFNDSFAWGISVNLSCALLQQFVFFFIEKFVATLFHFLCFKNNFICRSMWYHITLVEFGNLSFPWFGHCFVTSALKWLYFRSICPIYWRVLMPWHIYLKYFTSCSLHRYQSVIF